MHRKKPYIYLETPCKFINLQKQYLNLNEDIIKFTPKSSLPKVIIEMY